MRKRVGPVETKTRKRCQTTIRQISSANLCFLCKYWDAKPTFSPHNGSCQVCVCVCWSGWVCVCVRDGLRVDREVHAAQILTHLLTCFSNGVQMELHCWALQTYRLIQRLRLYMRTETHSPHTSIYTHTRARVRQEASSVCEQSPSRTLRTVPWLCCQLFFDKLPQFNLTEFKT